MERLKELINQLQEQFDRKADPSQMLLTTRLMEAELNRLSTLAAASRSSAKVAVMMPSSMKIYSGQSAAQEAKAVMPEPSRTAPEPAAPVRTVANGKESIVQQPIVQQPIVQQPIVQQPIVQQPVAQQPVTQQERGPWPFDPLADIPTLAQHQPREINDVIGLNGSSLNDKLKSNVLELKSALNDTPVRDLKKAIGVNDRFVFISQLFRGDEVMYERSLKTINGFRILPEAEYWMERELKVKLGWDETRETTRHFYQLVKRRFS